MLNIRRFDFVVRYLRRSRVRLLNFDSVPCRAPTEHTDPYSCTATLPAGSGSSVFGTFPVSRMREQNTEPECRDARTRAECESRRVRSAGVHDATHEAKPKGRRHKAKERRVAHTRVATQQRSPGRGGRWGVCWALFCGAVFTLSTTRAHHAPCVFLLVRRCPLRKAARPRAARRTAA